MHTEGVERGRLRVYLGAAPGVGKTYAMLNEAQRRRERGTDVVVGLVETHGREHTRQALADLDVIPRRQIDYRDTTLGELDVAAILERAPSVVLVDELAHTNVPGSPHTKRWQDVDELLAGGIDVITTVNIQHLESLNDVVESITGIRQRETIPDAVVRAAEAIELVDMSPEALRRRMAHGNIYAADKVDTALSHYFREGNLSALRELALLWLADRVDEGLDRYRADHGIAATWTTRERVVVGISGGAESMALMRRASRIASRTGGGEWLAVYVTRHDGLSGVSPDQLQRLRDDAHDLGGSFHVVVAHDPADGLLDFARGENASQVLVGASRRSRLSALFRPGIGEVVIARSGEIDVHIVTHAYARRAKRRLASEQTLGPARLVAGYLFAVLAPALMAALLVLTPSIHGLPTEALLMMSMVVLTALVGGLWPAVLAAVLSGITLNYLFVPPVHTLTMSDPENAFAIVVFLVVGIAVATLVDRAARHTKQAVQARSEANALSVLAHSLLHSGEDEADLLARACEVFGMSGAAVLQTEPSGEIISESSYGSAPRTLVEASVDVPIGANLALALSGHAFNAADRSLLTAYAAHLAVVRERQLAKREVARTRELTEGNKTRTALLAAVSHDLRSPLAAVKAAVSSLRTEDVHFSEADEAELLATIEESADRLDGLITNLLDMSRIQMGRINPLITEVDLADAVDHAVRLLPHGGDVQIKLPADLPPATADPGLLERVIANVVDNAFKHAGPRALVQITGSTWSDGVDAEWASVRIIDHGPGVPESLRSALFSPFQRLGDVPEGDGVGLGLAVARGLTEAMDGLLTAEDTPGGGLTMVIDLPRAIR